MIPKITESANPAAVGFRWRTEYPEFAQKFTEWEIVWMRSPDIAWMAGTRTALSDGWVNFPAPGIPRARTLAEARTIAREFAAPSTDDQ
jgi:hypothetical protein